MSQPAIKVQGLSKEYVIGHQQKGQETFREMVAGAVAAPFQRLRKMRGDVVPEERFWALKDINFEVQPGEVAGIIGRNGAGKSTLLKILSRITAPTHGEVQISGRVSSLLEVGTGFHPELTGRENIFLNGTILGMNRREIKDKFDEIVYFSGVEKFLDTPVKHYSSGMYMRLAFAVAAHLDTEILLVDEVLAVGDAAFQKKCLEKMDQVGKDGRTVIFVSHNLGVLKRICQHAFWLENGALRGEGDAATIVSNYMMKDIAPRAERSWEVPRVRSRTDAALRAVRICQPTGSPTISIDITRAFEIEVEIDLYRDLVDLNIGFIVSTTEGVVALHSADSFARNESWARPRGRWLARCIIPPYALNVGSYFLTIASDIPSKKTVLFFEENVMSWTVQSTCPLMDRYGPNAWKGISGPGVVSWKSFSKPQDG